MDDTIYDFGKLQQQILKKSHETYMKTCKESWKVTQVSLESPSMTHPAFHPEEGNAFQQRSLLLDEKRVDVKLLRGGLLALFHVRHGEQREAYHMLHTKHATMQRKMPSGAQ